jgi:hypothetical protein
LGRESQIIARDRRQVRSEVRQVFSTRKVASAFTVAHFYQNEPDLSIANEILATPFTI